ncbi:MAG TPA: carboxy terminal-processing peptidase, partial [Chitinophagales bacterium]|nr:carboxy terminal-processing peptidase [Chitinophagales bacterium]
MFPSARSSQSRFDRMSRTPLFLLLVVLTGLLVFASYKWFRTDENREAMLVNMLLDGVQTQHFDPAPVDDAYAQKVFDLFLQRMDFNKKFFLQSDVDAFKKQISQIDDQAKNNRYDFFETVNTTYEKRLKQVTAMYPSLLDEPFDFTKSESFETDGEKAKYVTDSVALREQWRKYLKFQVLARLDGMMEDAEKAKSRKDTAFTEKSFSELEAEAREKVKKSNKDGFERLAELDKEDRFNLYLNTLVNVQDPHTEYFPPADKANFDIAMTGQLQGIGAQLQERDGFIRVTSIIPGGPAYRDGRLKAGDNILKVKQETGDAVEVTEMRLDKAVQLIRGKKGTKVTLTIQKPEGSQSDITLTRDVVVLEETYAQSAVVQNGSEKIGYIRLPGFYADFSGSGGRDSGEDVKKELEKLKEQNIDGVILDLRDNGGGSLESVVKMVGLFIKTGPVVQVKTRSGNANVMSDNNSDVTYDGPLVVMVNEGSASASEIMAGAIQDYKRGLIIGSNTTFGKGTVQRMYNLDDMLNSSYNTIKPLGSLKITMQKYYRISGASVQLKGVVPDVIIPDLYAKVKYGEKEEDFPMKWDEIEKAKYDTYRFNYEPAIANSRRRIESNGAFKLIDEQSDELKRQSEATNVTLTLDSYRQRKMKSQQTEKLMKELEEEAKSLTVLNLPGDASRIAKDDTVRQRRNSDWLKELGKDIYLHEAAVVTSELN